MLMERYSLSADDAFQLLARLSQDSNTKLADVAVQVVEAGRASSAGQSRRNARTVASKASLASIITQ